MVASLEEVQKGLRNRDGSPVEEFELANGTRQLIAADTFTMAETVRSAKGIGSRRKAVLEAYVLLCNDVLVITQKQPDSTGNNSAGHTYKLLVDPLDLDQCTVTGVFYDDDNEFLVEENTKQAAGAEARDGASTIGQVVVNSYVFRCRSPEMKKEWLHKVYAAICKVKGLPVDDPPAQDELVNFRHHNSFTRRRSRKDLSNKLEEPHERRLQSKSLRRSQDEGSDSHGTSATSIAVSRTDSGNSIAQHLVQDAQRVADRRPIMRKFVDRLRRRNRHADEEPAPEPSPQHVTPISEGASKRLIESWEKRYSRSPQSDSSHRWSDPKSQRPLEFHYEHFEQHRQFFEEQASAHTSAKDSATARKKRFSFDIPTTHQNVDTLVQQLGGRSSAELKTLREDTLEGPATTSAGTYAMSWDYGDDFPSTNEKTDEMVVAKDNTPVPQSRSPRRNTSKSSRKSSGLLKRSKKGSKDSGSKRDTPHKKKKGVFHRMRESLRIGRKSSRKNKAVAPARPAADETVEDATYEEDTSPYNGYHPMAPRTALSRGSVAAGGGLSMRSHPDETDDDMDSVDLDLIRRDLNSFANSTLETIEEDNDLERLQESTLALRRQMEEEEEEFRLRRMAAEKQMEEKRKLAAPPPQAAQPRSPRVPLSAHLVGTNELPTLGEYIDANWQKLMYPTEDGNDLMHAAQRLQSDTGLLDELRRRQRARQALQRQPHLRQKWTGNLSRDVYGVNLLRREFQQQRSVTSRLATHTSQSQLQCERGALSPTLEQLIKKRLSSDEGVDSERVSQGAHTNGAGTPEVSGDKQDTSHEHVYETIDDALTSNGAQQQQQPDDTAAASDNESSNGSENGDSGAPALADTASPVAISQSVHNLYNTNVWASLPQEPVPISVKWSLAQNSQLAGLTSIQMRLLSVFVGAMGQCSETTNL